MRLTSKELNEALKKGQNISVILEMIQFKNEEKELCFKILTKTIEEFNISGLKNPDTLVKIVNFLNGSMVKAFEEYNNRGLENVQEFREFLELLVDFYQICFSFINGPIMNINEKWWTANKSDDFLEIYIIKFTEALEKIEEKLEDPQEKQNGSQQKNPKAFINIDIEQEFKKVGVSSFENIWEDCEIDEEIEGVPLKISTNEYVPKVKRKKSKKK